MIQTNSLLPHIDKDAQRRGALGKVYSLLIRLAEEAENYTALCDIVSEEEKIGELTPTRANEINKGADVYIDPQYSISDTERSNNSVPLKNNIPS